MDSVRYSLIIRTGSTEVFVRSSEPLPNGKWGERGSRRFDSALSRKFPFLFDTLSPVVVVVLIMLKIKSSSGGPDTLASIKPRQAAYIKVLNRPWLSARKTPIGHASRLVDILYGVL
ncbi:hypothetical protein FRC14_005994 [Serendipita sp. 396]|nr:hypothetical protein FRC14_005994 [Serendipita sp. 396]KAG8796916.1 hypothetical protein FRC16_009386 [Serendipita sp. 398]